VLRRFGNRKELAPQRFAEFVAAGVALGHRPEFYAPGEGIILGSEEFVDATIHRLGEVESKTTRKSKRRERSFDSEALLIAVETVFDLSRTHFCGSGKNSRSIMAKEVLILTGRDAGATITELSEIAELDTSTVSRRYDDASQSLKTDTKLAYATELVKKQYQANIAETQE
jgi:hypothetical protein